MKHSKSKDHIWVCCSIISSPAECLKFLWLLSANGQLTAAFRKRNYYLCFPKFILIFIFTSSLLPTSLYLSDVRRNPSPTCSLLSMNTWTRTWPENIIYHLMSSSQNMLDHISAWSREIRVSGKWPKGFPKSGFTSRDRDVKQPCCCQTCGQSHLIAAAHVSNIVQIGH